MEIRHQRVLLTGDQPGVDHEPLAPVVNPAKTLQRGAGLAAVAFGLMALATGPAQAADDDLDEDLLGSRDDPGLVVAPERRRVKLSGIDTEDFEVGISGGVMSIEDFGSSPVTISSLTYHVTEDFFAEARYGATELGETSFETLSGGARLVAEEDRDVQFYDLSVGMNLFPGEAFIWNRWALSSTFYVMAGAGATEFAGDQAFTVNAGFGYRLLANDFISFQVQVRDHMFDTELTGVAKTTHNLEMSAGISVFF